MVSLSNRGYPMLKMFFDMRDDEYMSREEAQHWDQRPFRSMLVRGYIRYTLNRGFRITRKGQSALRVFIATDIARKDPTKPLTRYFDLNAYKLRVVKKTA